MKDIENCPFCGSNKTNVDFKSVNNHNGYHITASVRCNVCHARGGTVGGYVSVKSYALNRDKITIVTKEELKEQAIAKWNRRV